MRKIKIYAAAMAAAFLLLFCLPGVSRADVEVHLIEDGQEFAVSDLKPSILPLTYMGPGKWIVEPVQADSLTYGNVKENFVRAVKPISDKLKPFPAVVNKKWVRPRVVITPVIITDTDHPGKLSGWYSSDYNLIALTWISVSEGEAGLRYAFAHELGHWVWDNVLTEDEKRNYRNLVGGPNKDDIGLAKKYGVEPGFLEMEWFAEDFRLYACGVAGETKSKLGMSRASLDELKKLFQVFVA